MSRLVTDLRTTARGRVATQVPIARLTSFRLGGNAAVLVEPENEEDLVAVGKLLGGEDLDCIVLGRGTNVLVSDSGFPGVVIRLGKGFEWVELLSRNGVKAGGNTPLPQVANFAARRYLSGLEFAVAIPAAVGGAVRMNAGAHGFSISDVLSKVRLYRVGDLQSSVVAASDLSMGYRTSAVGPRMVVCAAWFKLKPGNVALIEAQMDRYRAHRAETQPVEAPNAGSMFRNPENFESPSAGALIEQTGLKGFRAGGAEVSAKHANFFLARPGATAQDVYDLMARVQKTVKEATGVVLVPEIKLVGDFDRRESLEMAP
jgi:UDP-N-acetylmuramate dehydrogenase